MMVNQYLYAHRYDLHMPRKKSLSITPCRCVQTALTPPSRELPAYPPWDIPERSSPRLGKYRMTSADYRVSDSPSQRALNYRRIDAVSTTE
jgi:hypothetical protein